MPSLSAAARTVRPLFQKTTLALVIASSLTPQISYAGPDVAAAGGEFRVNTYTFDHQEKQQIAMDADGDFVVTWQGDSQDGSGRGIYAQRYSADGTPQGSEFRVNAHTNQNQINPQIAMDADGDFVVTWESNYQDGGGFGVYARAYNADGTDKTGEFRVNTYITSGQNNPQIAMDADGDFVVTWQSSGQDGSGLGVYARAYNADGTAKASGEVRVNTYTRGNQQNPQIAMDADGDFAVTWQSYGQDGSYLGVYARVYHADSTPKASGEERVNTYTTGNQQNPQIAMDADGDFVVTWESSYQDGSSYGVYARAFNADGTPKASGEVRVNTYTTNSQTDHRIDMDADGDFVVAWHSVGQDGSGLGIYVRAYSADGMPKQSSEAQVNTFTSGTQTTPQITMDADGDFAIIWNSVQDGDGYGVYARAYDADGTSRGTEILVNSYTTGIQGTPRIAMDADGDFVVTWRSNSQDGSGYGIYAQRFGTLVETDLSVSVNASFNPTPGYSEVNGSVTYSYVVGNLHATGAASGAGLDFRLPTGFVYDTFIGTNWSCTNTPPLSCDYSASIPAGSSAADLFVTLTMPATPLRANVIAKARSTETDSVPGNNGASALTVVCDPAAVDSLKLTSASVSEAVGTAAIRVTRTGGACSAASVNYATSNGTATAGSDYTAASGTLSWAATEQGAKTFNVAVINDTASETSETVTLTLSNGSLGTTLGPAGKLIIIDNDTVPTVSLTTGNQSISETGGVATITATLSATSGKAVTIPLTLTGTATNKKDYTLSAAKIVIPADSSSASITVSAVSDTIKEPNETVTLTMGTVTGATPTGTTANTVTLTDDDTLPTVSFAASSNYREGSAGNGGVARVILSNPSSQPVTVTVTHTGGTATLGSDFTLNNSGSITIPAGQTSVPAAFVVNDLIVESTETANFSLSNPSGATLGNATHALKIFDNDTGTSVFFQTFDGVHCSNPEPTPGCTFNAGSGTRITVSQDPDYDQFGYGTDDLWFVEFNSNGNARVFDDLGVYQYTAHARDFVGYIGGTTIGVGTDGTQWEDVAGNTYWFGDNGVLYSAEIGAANYGQAIN